MGDSKTHASPDAFTLTLPSELRTQDGDEDADHEDMGWRWGHGRENMGCT